MAFITPEEIAYFEGKYGTYCRKCFKEGEILEADSVVTNNNIYRHGFPLVGIVTCDGCHKVIGFWPNADSFRNDIKYENVAYFEIVLGKDCNKENYIACNECMNDHQFTEFSPMTIQNYEAVYSHYYDKEHPVICNICGKIINVK